MVEDALDVENSDSEEDVEPQSSALQEHNAIHGREQREIVTPNDFGASRFNMKALLGPWQALCRLCFLGVSTPDV
jgi:hypothetical protein